MSGVLAGLSAYADSDSGSDSELNAALATPHQKPSQAGKDRELVPATAQPDAATPTRMKRKLPPLSADTLQPNNTRLSPRSELNDSCKKVARGDWLCYCYVEVPLDRALTTLLRESHEFLQDELGSAHSLIDLRGSDMPHANKNDVPRQEAAATRPYGSCLHVSLTRPFTVRSYERDEYTKIASQEVQRLKEQLDSPTFSFSFSFSRISYLANDDASKHFMVLEVGSGREKLQKLSSSLSSELRRTFRAKSYYDEARFHASTAYVLTPGRSEDQPELTVSSAADFSSRFSHLVNQVEQRWGSELRKHSSICAARIGIQVGGQVTFVDL